MMPSTEQRRIMNRGFRIAALFAFGVFLHLQEVSSEQGLARGADLTVRVSGDLPIRALGAVRRWDQDGNPTREVDAKAKIEPDNANG